MEKLSSREDEREQPDRKRERQKREVLFLSKAVLWIEYVFTFYNESFNFFIQNDVSD